MAERRARRIGYAVAAPLALFALAIGVWYAVSYLLLDPSRRFLLPPPHSVVATAFFTWPNLLVILRALGTTIQVAGVGLGLAILIGLALAIVMAQSRHVERALYPYLVVLQTVPILALIPLIGFWLGFGEGGRVVVCVLVALFPIVTNAHFGLRSTTESQRDLFRLQRAGRLATLAKLELPAALPAIFTGLRISAGLSVVGEIVGGFFFQQGPGDLGILLETYVANLDGPMLFGTIAAASALGVAVYTGFTVLANTLVGNWRE
jgi:NitT/TauT family transport system permease protein